MASGDMFHERRFALEVRRIEVKVTARQQFLDQWLLPGTHGQVQQGVAPTVNAVRAGTQAPELPIDGQQIRLLGQATFRWSEALVPSEGQRDHQRWPRLARRVDAGPVSLQQLDHRQVMPGGRQMDRRKTGLVAPATSGSHARLGPGTVPQQQLRLGEPAVHGGAVQRCHAVLKARVRVESCVQQQAQHVRIRLAGGRK